MCDVKRYEAIFEEIMRLQPDDTMQLVWGAEEQKTFYRKKLFMKCGLRKLQKYEPGSGSS